MRLACLHCEHRWESYEKNLCPECESGDIMICPGGDTHECETCGSELKSINHEMIVTCMGCGQRWRLISGLLQLE